MPQDDPFSNYARGLESPGETHFQIVPADGVDLPVRPRVLYVLAGGSVAIRDASGVVLSYPVVTGQILPFSAVGIDATGTTATVVGWI